ncbi:MAG TPA: DNA polymerase I [Anaerolineales bacterium]|nr:DNA polymerase I [Anaerolineales bacterium]
MPPTIYLLDGHALAYRAYYALTRGSPAAFTTHAGEPTAGVYGFTSILLRILEQDRPDYLAVTFDTGKTFRDEMFPEYKATRAKMPDDLRPQMKRIRQLVDAFNIPRLELEGYEADDVLGSLACQLSAQGYGVKIITGDRDLLQLVNERILVNLPGKGGAESKDYFAQDVLEYLGVRPDQVIDYKALVGDTSDNIPGVTGIGEKTAVNLLAKYETLEGIYAHLDELADGVRKKLEAGRANADLSRRLATIVTDLPLKMDLDKARTEHFDPEQVEAIFRELEFRTLLKKLTDLYPLYGKAQPAHKGQQLSLFETAAPPPAEAPAPALSAAPGPIDYQVIDTPAALKSLAERLQKASLIAFDTETTSTDPMRADLVGISLAVEGSQGYYIPVGHNPGMGKQLPLKDVLEALRGPLTDPRIQKAGHNLKYDFIMLARQGLRTAPLSFDTMIAEWLTNPASHNLGLKNLAWVRLNLSMTEIQALIGSGKNQRSMAEVPVVDAAAYAAADAAAVMQLIPHLRAELEAGPGLRLLEEIEMPLVSVLADMEMTGISLDTSFLAQMSAELATRLAEIETQVYELVGQPFNINSTQQLSQALFERLKLSPPDRTRRTERGHYSTSADVLEALSGKHPVVDLVLEQRELSKLKSTYLDALPLQVNPNTGRVHTSYNQTGSVTGRIASSDPNLQNIPIRTDLGRQVRRAFVAAPGWQLLSVDYSQVELRIAAHMADDQAMLNAFRLGQDIHAATAAAIFGIPLEQVNKTQRRHAKAVNFGLIYGMSAFGLTRSSELTLAEAEDFIDAYFKQFPGIKSYLDGIRLLAAQQGYVETLLGRRRLFPGLKTQQNQAIRNREEREAINAPIQGTAADIMKIAMLHLPPALKEAGLSARILLQVHDELVLECPSDQLRPTAELVRTVMEKAYSLKAPLRAETRSGQNWGELMPLEL